LQHLYNRQRGGCDATGNDYGFNNSVTREFHGYPPRGPVGRSGR
jgi:hypothetical protein